MGIQAQEQIMDERLDQTEFGNVLLTESMTVGPNGNSLKHTIPSEAVKIYDLTPADAMQIDVFEQHYICRPPGISRQVLGSEPLYAEPIEVKVCRNNGSGSSLKHTIPEDAARLQSLSAGDEVVIDIYHDWYAVQAAALHGGDEHGQR